MILRAMAIDGNIPVRPSEPDKTSELLDRIAKMSAEELSALFAERSAHSSVDRQGKIFVTTGYVCYST